MVCAGFAYPIFHRIRASGTANCNQLPNRKPRSEISEMSEPKKLTIDVHPDRDLQFTQLS